MANDETGDTVRLDESGPSPEEQVATWRAAEEIWAAEPERIPWMRPPVVHLVAAAVSALFWVAAWVLWWTW